jgi:hypothetical protein
LKLEIPLKKRGIVAIIDIDPNTAEGVCHMKIF